MQRAVQPLQIGVVLPSREAALTGRHDPRRLVGFAVECEQLGFDSVWAGDSLLARTRAEPLTLLAAVAMATESIGIGTAALTAALRNPLGAAHTLATLDQLSGGRLTCALGSGFPYPETEREFEAAGIPFRGRLERLAETVELWRAAWGAAGAEEVSHEGRLWQIPDVRGLPEPARPGGPPLWFAGAGSAGLQIAGAHFDGWLPYPAAAEDYRTGLERLRSLATDAGRSNLPDAALYVTVLPGHVDTAAVVDEYCLAYYGVGLELIEQFQAIVHGPPEYCVERLSEYVDAGASHLVIRIGTLDPQPVLKRLAVEVASPLRSSRGSSG